jgi:signal transduction histidine kinase
MRYAFGMRSFLLHLVLLLPLLVQGELKQAPAISVLVDESRALTLEQVREMPFAPASGANFGYTDSAIWLRMDLKTEEGGTRWAVIRYPRIPQVDFYAMHGDGRVEHHRSGTDFPIESRAVWAREHIFPFSADAGEPVEIFIRAVSSVSLQLPLQTWTPESYLHESTVAELRFGFFMAYMLALVLVGFTLAITLRERVAAVQAVAILLHVAVMYCVMGHAELFGFPWKAYFSFKGVAFLAHLSMALTLVYVADLFNIRNRWPRFFRLYLLYFTAEVLLVAALAVCQSTVFMKMHLWSLVLMSLILIGISVVSACQRYRPAYYFTIGWVFFFTTLVVQSLHYLGLVRATWSINYNVYQSMALIGTTFFVFAVADRARMIRTERDLVKAELLERTRSEAERLCRMVDERTVELREAKEAAEAANEQKTWFIANVSHDLRAPISSLISLTNIFSHHSNELNLPERFNRFLGQLRSGGDFLMLVLNNILDLSVLEMNAAAVRPETFDLKEWCGNMTNLVRSLAEARNVQVQCTCSGGKVQADRTRLSQVLLNLAQNAVKFSPEKGTVCIELCLDADALHLNVCDEGPGIAPEERMRIFDLFAQGTAGPSHRSGVGLGLNIVQRNVELLGGAIRLSDAVGGGSCFSATIPLSRIPQAE